MKTLPIALLLVACVFLSSCWQSATSQSKDAAAKPSASPSGGIEYFTENSDGSLSARDGTRYVFFANEGAVELLGDKSLVGKVRGENDIGELIGFRVGLYACAQDSERVMLLRHLPDSEWCTVYRKESAPKLDASSVNIIRLEFVGYREETDANLYTAGAQHLSCGKGITGKESIDKFFRDVTSGKTAEAAGLYKAIEQPDGTLKNCYELGKVYGFFAGENSVAVPYTVQSFDDQAYSITIDGTEYVLAEGYLKLLGYDK